VRIVEQNDDSKSASKSPTSARDDSGSKEGSRSQNSAPISRVNTYSSSGGHETLDSGSYFSQEPSYMSDIPEFMDSLVSTEAWDMGDPNMPLDMFDSLMNMGPNT
jgi:hypothetical protein